MLVRDEKFGDIHNLNLVEAYHSKIFAERKSQKTRITKVFTAQQLPIIKKNFEDSAMCPNLQSRILQSKLNYNQILNIKKT